MAHQHQQKRKNSSASAPLPVITFSSSNKKSKFYLKWASTNINLCQNRGYESGSDYSDSDNITLSRFRYDVMKLLVENFPQEYEISTKKHLEKAMLYLPKKNGISQLGWIFLVHVQNHFYLFWWIKWKKIRKSEEHHIVFKTFIWYSNSKSAFYKWGGFQWVCEWRWIDLLPRKSDPMLPCQC